MKKSLLFILGALLLFQCDDENTDDCTVPATVRDLTGLLDGCGWVLELADGKRLEPERIFFCGTPPLPEEVTEDPLYGFEFRDGQKVRISYEETNHFSICMVGPTVKITCIEEVTSFPEEDR